jgi:integrase
MDYLTRVGQTFYARIPVPKDLQHFFPAKEFKQSLRTKNRTDARRLLSIIVAGLQQTFFQWRFLLKMKPPSPQAIAIFKLRHPNRSPRTAAKLGEPSLNGSGWRPVDEVLLIQTDLDMGFVPDESGNFDVYGALPPQPRVPQAVQHIEQRDVKSSGTLVNYTGSTASLIEEFLKQDTHTKAKTSQNKGYTLNHLKSFAQSKKVSEILSTDSMYTFLNKYLVNTGQKHSTRVANFKVLKTLLDYCKRKNFINKDTLDEIKQIKLVKTQVDMACHENEANESYTHSELQALLDSCIDKPAVNNTASLQKRLTHIRLIYYILTAMFTGFRAQTLGQLTKDGFDFSSEVHTMTIKNELVEINGRMENTNKTYKSLQLPIAKQLEKFHFRKFVNLAVHDNNIFPVTATLDQRLDKQLVSIVMKKQQQRIHSIRATVDNLYVSTGNISTDDKELLMGHALQGVSAHYTSFKTQMRDYPKDVANKVNRALVYDIDFSRITAYLENELSFFK